MAELPTGTITFLFTDIEGSTARWERHPEVMRRALVRHDALLAASVERHGGQVVRPRGEGDSLFCVFRRAPDAVAAALDAQRAIAAEDWGEVAPIRVRMALHTGEADARGGDYYGCAVNRCARLRSLAHGGQVLLSQATRDLAREALPAKARLRNLGRHRLKDLKRLEQVYQLIDRELPTEFPPLKSLDTARRAPQPREGSAWQHPMLGLYGTSPRQPSVRERRVQTRSMLTLYAAPPPTTTEPQSPPPASPAAQLRRAGLGVGKGQKPQATLGSSFLQILQV